LQTFANKGDIAGVWKPLAGGELPINMDFITAKDF
jgi:hypothetical protein